MIAVGVQLGNLPLTRLYEAQQAIAAPSVPSFPPGLTPIAWVDMAQQMGVDGTIQAILQDNIVPARTYSGSRIFRANRQNGLPALQTDPYSYAISANSYPAIAANQPCLFWLVAKSDGSDSYLWEGMGNTQVRFNTDYSNLRMSIYIDNLNYSQSSPISLAEATTWASYLIHRDSLNQVRYYYNGLPKFAAAASTGGAAMSLRSFLGGYYPYQGELGEAGILSNPSQAQINQLGQYLRDKWAIAWTNI